MIRDIHLHGALGEKYGKVHTLDASTVALVVAGITSRDPQFKQTINNGSFAVVIGDLDDENNQENLTEETMQMSFGDNDTDIHIIPEVEGNKGFFQFVLGAVMVVGGMYMNVVAPGSGTWLIQAGIGVGLGGLAQMLSPNPTMSGERESAEETPSFMFNGPTNRSEQGGAVPLVYGQCMAGSTVISTGIDAEEVSNGNDFDFGYNFYGYNALGSMMIR